MTRLKMNHHNNNSEPRLTVFSYLGLLWYFSHRSSGKTFGFLLDHFLQAEDVFPLLPATKSYASIISIPADCNMARILCHFITIWSSTTTNYNLSSSNSVPKTKGNAIIIFFLRVIFKFLYASIFSFCPFRIVSNPYTFPCCMARINK